MQAACLFEQHIPAEQVARLLRVSAKSAYQWQRIWREQGRAGLVSKGPGGSACRLDPGRLRRLQDALDEDPAAYGWVERLRVLRG
jgi:transposase